MRGMLAHVALLLALLVSAIPAHADAAAAPRDDARLTRGDAVFALATGAAVALAMTQDRWATRQVASADGATANGLASTAERLGNTGVVGPTLVGFDLVARASGHPHVGAATERVALSVAAVGVSTILLKQVVGRSRPYESPDDPYHFTAFSGHTSFPSGHTSVAFAVAGALSCESRARWVPWVTLPAASAVAWSRVHDRAHWLSDVVAGGAWGWWASRKVDRLARTRWPDGLWVLVVPHRDGATLRLDAHF